MAQVVRKAVVRQAGNSSLLYDRIGIKLLPIRVAALFFVFSKLFGFAIDPVNFFGLLFMMGAVFCLMGRLSVGRRVIAVSAAMFVICCFSPAGAILVRVLENRFSHVQAFSLALQELSYLVAQSTRS